MQMRPSSLNQTSLISLAIIAFVAFLFVANFLNGDLWSLLASSTDTGTTASPSGLELVTSNGLDELSMLRGCAVDDVLKRQSNGNWACDDDSTVSGTGTGLIALDLGDDDSNESDALTEIAVTGDTNSVFTEPSSNKLLIAVGSNWPTADTADTADALTNNPADCSANQFANAIATSGDLTCAAISDADIPDSITIDLADLATALATNGTNCAAGQAPLGVDASGAAESCTDFEEDLSNSAGLAAALSDETGAGLAVFNSAPTLTGVITIDSSGSLVLPLDCSGFSNGGTLSVTGSGVVGCQDDDSGAGSQNLFETINASSGTNPVADSTTDTLNVTGGTGITVTGDASTDTITIASTIVDTDTNAETECAGTTTYLDGEGNCDTLDGLEDFETATDDGLAVGNGTGFDTKVLADCDDSGGNHLNYDTTANAFSCGTSSSVTDTNTNASTECAGDTTYFSGEGNCNDISSVYADVLGDTFTGTVSVTGSADFILNLDCSSFSNGGVLSTTAGGVVECQDDDSAAGSAVDVEENGVSAVTGATALDFQDPFDVANDGGAADISIDFTEIDDTTFGSGSAFSWTFDAGASDPVLSFLSGVFSFLTHILLDNESELRWGEADGNGSNYIAVKAPDAVTSNQTCTLDDSATPFDPCVTANPADQNLFQTIGVPTGTDPVADSTTDTLTLTSNQGTISVTGDASSDTINFEATDVNCTGCLGTTEIAGLDISDDTNLTCGRSLTLSGDGCDADAELYTDSKGIWFEDPTADDDFKTIWAAVGNSYTITSISCETDGTVTFDLQIDDGTPTGVNGSDITCTTFATTSSLAGDTELADGERLDLATTAVTSSTFVSIIWTFTKND